MSKVTGHYDLSKFPVVPWVELESWAGHQCDCGHPECAHTPFTEKDPPEIAVKCHTGAPLYVAYWDSWLYLSCAECGKPIGKIAVKQSLL